MRKLLCSAAALLSLVLNLAPRASAQAQTPPQTQGVEQRVEAILKQMTLEEKIDLLGGIDDFFVRGRARHEVDEEREEGGGGA